MGNTTNIYQYIDKPLLILFLILRVGWHISWQDHLVDTCLYAEQIMSMVGWDQGCAFHHMLLECVTGQVTGRTLGRDSELFESHGGLAIKRHNNIMRFGMIYEWS